MKLTHAQIHDHSVSSGAGAISTDQDIEITLNTKNLILKSADNSRWKFIPGNNGVLTLTKIV